MNTLQGWRTISRKAYGRREHSFVFGAAETSKTVSIDFADGICGEVIKLVVVMPDWTNTVTARLTMNNVDGHEVYESLAMDKNEEYNITPCRKECLQAGETGEEWVVTLSGVPGGTGGTITLNTYMGI